MSDEIREAFESYLRKKWQKRTDPFLRPCNDINSDRTYQDFDTDSEWETWQATIAWRDAQDISRNENKALRNYILKNMGFGNALTAHFNRLSADDIINNIVEQYKKENL